MYIITGETPTNGNKITIKRKTQKDAKWSARLMRESGHHNVMWYNEKTAMTLEEEIKTKGRQVFIADFVHRITRKKANREEVYGYHLRKCGNKYMLMCNGMHAGYGDWKTAEMIHDTISRKMSFWVMRAEEMVTEVLYC